MVQHCTFTQEPHPLLVIPGPIEVTDEVLYANAHPTMSHMSPDFAAVFGEAIRLTREVVHTEHAQPFLIAGSGTLGWDQVAANLVEHGERALVLHCGYFADSFADCLQTYGAHVDQIRAEIGGTVPDADVATALKSHIYKLVTVTHVDTSTGVLSDVKRVAEVVRSISPDTLVVVDGVCSVGSEEIRMDEWNIDVVLTASQKGLGTPPGLSILLASQRAIKVYETRKTPIASYYASWKKWLPVMHAYEAGRAAYFATPPVNLMYAYHASLQQILSGPVSPASRLAAHAAASARVRTAVSDLGMRCVPLTEEVAAHGMTAVYFPDGLGASDIIPRLLARGIVVAGGLHASIKDSYFRIGHMGATAVDAARGDIERVVDALQETLAEARAGRA